jgi:hypothetical protein
MGRIAEGKADKIVRAPEECEICTGRFILEKAFQTIE